MSTEAETVSQQAGGPLFSVLLVSTAAIGYEILLIRLLSIVQWHHFAWMIISLALLGYAASGTAIALTRFRLRPRFEPAFTVSAGAFSLSMVVCMALGQRVPFNALEIIWDPLQLAYLFSLYLLFMLPFFFAAFCIGLCFAFRGGLSHRVYFFDLLGAGLGAGLAIGLLFWLPPQRAVPLLALLPALATLPFLIRRRRSASVAIRAAGLLALGWLAALILLAANDRIGLRVSPFKGLSQALEVVDARVLTERSGPLGQLTVVESPRVPFRYAPGLGITATQLPPEQLAVFTDGDGISVINRVRDGSDDTGFLRDVAAAAPYRLLIRPRVLVLGAGAGYDVSLALANGAARVDAVELNPQILDLLRFDFAEYAGHPYEDERIRWHLAEARGYVSRDRGRYDLVQLSPLDSAAVSSAGAQALGENYLFTVEAFGEYLGHLAPGGMLATTRWLRLPPRDSLKLAAIAIEALRRSGVDDPGRRLVLLRSWSTATLLVRNGDFGPAEIDGLRAFARERSFDMAWYPGMPEEEANRFNRLERPWLYEGVSALLGGRADAYLRDYKFSIDPATDRRPYFSNFFKWRALPEILSLRERGGAGLFEWGYLVRVATLLQAVVAGAAIVLLPLWWKRRAVVDRGVLPAPGGGLSYFFLLGLAFLFVEMAFIQKFVLFLTHPLYSVAVMLAGFLVFAGLGSASAPWLGRRLGGEKRAVGAAVLLLAGIVLTYLWGLPAVFRSFLGSGDAFRVVLTLLLIAPLGFCMGIPFPLGLRRLDAEASALIPWAWALNGFASVMSAALATLLAVELGFDAVLLIAVGLYLAAGVLFQRGPRAVTSPG